MSEWINWPVQNMISGPGKRLFNEIKNTIGCLRRQLVANDLILEIKFNERALSVIDRPEPYRGALLPLPERSQTFDQMGQTGTWPGTNFNHQILPAGNNFCGYDPNQLMLNYNEAMYYNVPNQFTQQTAMYCNVPNQFTQQTSSWAAGGYSFQSTRTSSYYTRPQPHIRHTNKIRKPKNRKRKPLLINNLAKKPTISKAVPTAAPSITTSRNLTTATTTKTDPRLNAKVTKTRDLTMSVKNNAVNMGASTSKTVVTIKKEIDADDVPPAVNSLHTTKLSPIKKEFRNKISKTQNGVPHPFIDFDRSIKIKTEPVEEDGMI